MHLLHLAYYCTFIIILNIVQLCQEYTSTVVSMANMSHENCGLDYSPMNLKEHSNVKKPPVANEIDVSDQSE